MDNAVVAGFHLIFNRRETVFDFLKPFAAFCNETAAFVNEEEYPGGKDADDAEFFDSLQKGCIPCREQHDMR